MHDDFRNKRKSVNHNLADFINAYLHQLGAIKERTAILSPCIYIIYDLYLLVKPLRHKYRNNRVVNIQILTDSRFKVCNRYVFKVTQILFDEF